MYIFSWGLEFLFRKRCVVDFVNTPPSSPDPVTGPVYHPWAVGSAGCHSRPLLWGVAFSQWKTLHPRCYIHRQWLTQEYRMLIPLPVRQITLQSSLWDQAESRLIVAQLFTLPTLVPWEHFLSKSYVSKSLLQALLEPNQRQQESCQVFLPSVCQTRKS